MNEKNLSSLNRSSAAAIGFLAGSFIFIVMAVAVRFSLHVPAVDEDRAALISKSLADNQKLEAEALNNAGWADQPRGFVRLPIETAMQQTAQAWKNPAAARADLNARAEKAAAPAPAKPSAFE